ncbi:hypothetical protein Tsubulata_051366, partial [Turnera subulata]
MFHGFLVFFFLLFSTSKANDGDAMLMLAKSIHPLPPSWSNKSSVGMCANWEGVSCDSSQRVFWIELRKLGLSGTLPLEIGNLSELSYLDLQGNYLSGDLRPLVNLSKLETVLIDSNRFTSIPSNFFQGLAALKYFRISNNSYLSPWNLPATLAKCTRLFSFAAESSNMIGPLPDIFSSLPNLAYLELGYNSLSGPLPKSLAISSLKTLEVNDQEMGLTGTIDVIASMRHLTEVWLQGNNFTGPIPDLSNCKNIYDLRLADNHLTGLVPASLFSLPKLFLLAYQNNKLQGPAPVLPGSIIYDNLENNFCADTGVPCDRQVSIMLQIAGALGYPELLSDNWHGNDACKWGFVACDTQKRNIIMVNFSGQHFVGTISPAFANLTFLKRLYLNDNNLTGPIPDSLTSLKQLELMDVSNNN